MTDGRHMRGIIGKAGLVTTISIHDIDFPFPSRSEEKAILPGVPEGGGNGAGACIGAGVHAPRRSNIATTKSPVIPILCIL